MKWGGKVKDGSLWDEEDQKGIFYGKAERIFFFLRNRSRLFFIDLVGLISVRFHNVLELEIF